MDISICGRSYFTEDGFDIRNYGKHELRRAICKINGNVMPAKKTVIVTQDDFEPYSHIFPIIATYSEDIDGLVCSDNFLNHFQEATFEPFINCIIAKDTDELSILAYGNSKCNFLTFESEDAKIYGLMVITMRNFNHYFAKIFALLSKIFGEKIKVQVIGYQAFEKPEYRLIFEHLLKRYDVDYSFLHPIEEEFEMYNDGLNNHIVIIK